MDQNHLPATVFEPVDVPSTYEETIARLGVAIRIGMLEPGTRLPPERELAERLSISRSTLRQALASLTETGHLIAMRGRSGGTFVAERPPLASADPFPLARTRTLLDWRRAIEIGAVQLAAERVNGSGLDAIDGAVELFDDEEVVSDWTRFRRADASFHVRLAEATGSDMIVAAVTHIHGDLSDLFSRLEPPVTARKATAAEHREVVAAIRSGDSTAARDAMHRHLVATESVLDQLKTDAE
jgi:DNA-binding FadR family transcriptional regulator